MGRMPLLEDAGRVVAETSIIIEHLQQHHVTGDVRLIPDDPAAALQVRYWDRICDFYVMTLLKAYGVRDRQLANTAWLAGRDFSLADCAAAPSLFYAVAYVPFPDGSARLSAYFERLMEQGDVAAVVDAARPWLGMFPGRDGLARRFYDPRA